MSPPPIAARTDRDVGQEQVHRALSSPVRRRVVELLGDGGGLDVRQLAERVGLHVNTVRTHLTILEESGLVTSEPEQRGRPGRPRLLYRATEPAGPPVDAHGYRFLAEVLAGQLAATADDPALAAEAAGDAWGHYLVETAPPSSPLDPRPAVARVVELLEEFGFKPEADDADPASPRVLLRRCPFVQVAREHQDVVCSIHLGIMRGALEVLGGRVELIDLIPFVNPDLCVAHLRATA